MNKRKLLSILRIGLTIFLLIFVFSRINLQVLVEQIRNVEPIYYVLGVLVYFGFIVCWSFRWRYLIRASGENVPLAQVVVKTLVGEWFSLFLPESVGSDLARMYGLSQDTGKKTNAISTVLLDRAIALISLALMAMVALVFNTQFQGYREVLTIVLMMAAGLVVGWFLFFNKQVMGRFSWVLKLPYVQRFEGVIRNLYQALYDLQKQPRLVFSTLLISLFVQTVNIFVIVLIARSLGIQISLIYFFLFVPIIWVIMTIPISVSGLGVRENAFAFFFGQVGVAVPEALALSLLYFSCRILSGALGGIIFARLALMQSRHVPSSPAAQQSGAVIH